MKKLLYILLILFVFQINLQSQIPQSFNYQAIARNSDGEAIATKQITIEMSILQGNNCNQNPSGCTVLWQELHFPTTNSYGMFSINIGEGQNTFSGTLNSFSQINWSDQSSGKYYLRTRADFGDTPYLNGMVDLGTVTFLSVPYSFSSQKSDSLVKNSNKVSVNLTELQDVNISSPSSNQVISWNGSQWVNSNVSISVPNNIGDLNDVTISSPANNQFLMHNGTNWQNNAISLTNISDFSISSPSTGQILAYNGTKWINQNNIWTDGGSYVYNNIAKRLGFQTTTPLSAFHIDIPTTAPFQFGAFLVTGTYDATNNGVIEVSGAGTKMFFAPTRAAFRAGNINGTQWNSTSVGNYSFAFGRNSTASATYSGAFGYNTIASGVASLAMGEGTTTSGAYSMTIGVSNTVSGDMSFALGIGLNSNSYGCLTLGRYNKNNGAYNPTNWTNTDPIIIIGNGTSSVARNNAMVVLKNGDILTIGTVLTGQTNPGKNFMSIDAQKILNLKSYYDTEKKTYLISSDDLKNNFPELLKVIDDEVFVNYTGLVPVLVEKIKQQQTEIDDLKQKQNELQKQLLEINQRLSNIENK